MLIFQKIRRALLSWRTLLSLWPYYWPNEIFSFAIFANLLMHVQSR